MAVTFLSNGYDSTTTNPYTEAEWAEAFPSIGLAAYGVRSPADWKVSAVAGQDRTVSIAAGRGWGYGVTDKTVANDTIQLATIASGSRWDLIVVRRDWNPTAGTSKFEKIAGGSTATIPGGRLVGPGNIDDQPLALVQVTAGQTQPSAIIDLRTWAGDGGGLVGAHDLVRSYLNATGTRIWIEGTDWVRKSGANDTPEWVKFSEAGKASLYGFGAAILGAPETAQPGFLIQSGTVVATTDAAGYARLTWPKPFPNGVLAVHLSNGDDWAAGVAFFTPAGSPTINGTPNFYGTAGIGNKTEIVYAVRGLNGLLTNKPHRISYTVTGF